LGEVSDLAVDKRGQLWVVENQDYPKRITRWDTDGTFKKELLGNTEYGSGGVLSPYDRSELFYKGLRFELDWETGDTRLAALMTRGRLRKPERPIRHKGERYLVTRTPGAKPKQPYAVVYRRKGERAIPAAAMGNAGQFPPLKDPATYTSFGTPVLKKHRFLWTDRNGDGAVAAEEITLEDLEGENPAVTSFNRDMSIHNARGAFRYVVKKVLENGVPVYEKERVPAIRSDVTYGLFGKGSYRLGGAGIKEAVLEPDGTPRWTYETEGRSVHGYKKAGP
jgi:hypothetical protein